MKIDLFELFVATLGTMGFSFVFNVKKKRLIPVGIGGMFGWITYVLVNNYYNNTFISNMVATFVLCIYAEICARKLKAPASVFLVPSVFPLIPGSGLYYTMEALVRGDKQLVHQFGTSTALATLGIVLGMLLGTSFFYSIILRIKSILTTREN